MAHPILLAFFPVFLVALDALNAWRRAAAVMLAWHIALYDSSVR